MKKSVKKGFMATEAIVVTAVFSILVTSFVGLLMYVHRINSVIGNRSRAMFIADEGIEISRAIRNKNFSDLSIGTHGTALSSGSWIFSGSSDSADIFTRKIKISDVNDKEKEIVSTVEWNDGVQRSVSLAAYLTDWQMEVGSQKDYLEVDYSSATWANGNKELRGINLENIGSSDIVIDKITVYWNGNPAQRIEEIVIDGITVWRHSGIGSPSGKHSSGTELDIEDVLISPSIILDIDAIKFSRAMTGTTIDITFTMIDGTQKEVTGILP